MEVQVTDSQETGRVGFSHYTLDGRLYNKEKAIVSDPDHSVILLICLC